MEKAVYGLAADFNTVHFNIKANEQVDYYYLDEKTLEYAQNIALTLEHKPKQTITTIAQPENGQLIFVQKGPLLFFKFIPSTKEGERIYRKVKMQQLRKCSFMFFVKSSRRDFATERKLGEVFEKGETILVKSGVVFEICLTNTPRDENTFCTTDAKHPMLQGIEWETNIKLSDQCVWEEHLILVEMDEKLDELQQELARLNKQSEKLLKERGILL